MPDSIALSFAEPIPIFPLPGVVMLPHSALPLHIFEPRYRQMVERTLEEGGRGRAKPIAIATIQPGVDILARNPEVREAVCVGHIVKQQRRPDNSFDIILQGLCRAAILKIEEPDAAHLYRRAHLRPLDNPSATVPGLRRMRTEMRNLLRGLRMKRLHSVRSVLEWIDRPELSHQGAIELVAFSVITNEEVRYKVLAEPDPYRRARMIWADIERTDRLIAKAQRQVGDEPPRGVSWN